MCETLMLIVLDRVEGGDLPRAIEPLLVLKLHPTHHPASFSLRVHHHMPIS